VLAENPNSFQTASGRCLTDSSTSSEEEGIKPTTIDHIHKYSLKSMHKLHDQSSQSNEIGILHWKGKEKKID
jgi:hypothetical protein